MVGIERLLELSEELKNFAEELGEVPTALEMKKHGPYDPTTYQRNFGSWNEALKVAGLKINEMKKDVKSKEKLIKDLRQFAKDLGRTPTVSEMDDRGPWSSNPYYDHFGTWNNALKEAGLEINRLDMGELAGTGEYAYGSDWEEMRQVTLERDNYTCQVCGFEDESNHVHHIKPRSEFDDVSDSNTVNNLITLCVSCHGRCEGRWKNCDPDEFAAKASDTFM